MFIQEKEIHIQMSSRKSPTEINLKNQTLVSSETLASMLGLTTYTVRAHYRDRKVPGTKIGRTIYFNVDKVCDALSIARPSTVKKERPKHDPTADM